MKRKMVKLVSVLTFAVMIGMSVGVVAEHAIPDWSSPVRVFASAVTAFYGGRLFDRFWPKPKPGWR